MMLRLTDLSDGDKFKFLDFWWEVTRESTRYQLFPVRAKLCGDATAKIEFEADRVVEVEG